MNANQDQTLIAKAKADPTHYEQLYTKYATAIFNYFWYRTGHNRDIAEDLMQETFIRAFKNLNSYQERGYSYRTYLQTIAHNLLVNYYRSAKAIALDDVVNIPAEPIRDINDKIDAKQVWQAIQEDLTKSEQNVVLLKYRQELPIKDIARITHKSENAVKLQLSRARKKLRNDARLATLAGFSDIKKPYTKPRFLKHV